MMNRVLLFSTLLLAAACGDKDDTAAEDTAGGGGEADGSFASVQEVFTQSCAFSSCHGAGSGGLTLAGDASDHAALVGVAAFGDSSQTLVVAGDADGSYLVAKMEGAAGISGDVMPPGAALGADTVAIVRAWIDAGAPE